MFKNKGTSSVCALLVGLCISVSTTVAPAWGQIIEPGTELSVAAGPCFNSEASSRSCWAAQLSFRLYRAPHNQGTLGQAHLLRFASNSLMQTGRNPEPTSISWGGTVSLNTDTWPDKPPPDGPTAAPVFSSKQSDAAQDNDPPKVKHRGTFSFTVDLFLPIAIEPRFVLEPFAGAGVGHVRQDEARMPDQSTVTDQTFPVLTYGLGLTMRRFVVLGATSLDLRIQYRGLVFFPKNPVEYIAPDGRSFEADLGTVNNANLLIGFGIRL